MSPARTPSTRRELPKAPCRVAFTLIELLVVIAIIAILAALLLPVLSRAKAMAHGIKCVNNAKQLQLAWQMYADDHQQQLPNVGGWCRGNFTDPPGPDNTNLDLLRNGQLGPYLVNTDVYKCPGDKSANVRSFAMNNHMNGICFDNAGLVFKKDTSITQPSEFFVFIDEDIRTINDPLFRVDMSSGIGDRPASYHNRKGTLSFADGHVETHRWSGANSAADREWLRDHTTERIP